MDAKSVFDTLKQHDIQTCIFCKWKMQPNIRACKTSLYTLHSYSNSLDSTVVMHVGMESFQEARRDIVTKKIQEPFYITVFAPSRFDLVFSMGNLQHSKVDLVYHITNCYAGWIFNFGVDGSSEKCNSSLHYSKYKHIVKKIFETHSVDHLTWLIMTATVGFSLLGFKSDIFDGYTIRYTIRRSILDIASRLKIMLFKNLPYEECAITDLSRSIDEIANYVMLKIDKCSNFHELHTTLFERPLKPHFKYITHYTFYDDFRKNQQGDIPTISTPLGVLNNA